ncbi:hypothetical protein [Streptomyces sp. NPDC001537]
MVGDDEDYGQPISRSTLMAQAPWLTPRLLGQRIPNALNRATNGIARQISWNLQNSLRNVPVQIRIEPDLRRFDAQLLDGLRGIDSLNIPVGPDVRERAPSLCTAPPKPGLTSATSRPILPTTVRRHQRPDPQQPGLSLRSCPETGEVVGGEAGRLWTVGGVHDRLGA